MNLKLKASSRMLSSSIQITGSKSETNRLLLLQALYPLIEVENISESDDADAMIKALHSTESVIDVHHAGTAMRFLTAFFAVHGNREILLTGSSRMKERPIGILVDALRELGAKIEYAEKEGYPPLRIGKFEITNNKVSLKADVSSQYITALLLVVPKLKNGIEITLQGKITSLPYINMTLGLLAEVGIDAQMTGNVIKVSPLREMNPVKVVVESDWSSASYFYSLIALAEEGSQIELSSYRQGSLQGDSALIDIYKFLGVETTFSNDSIVLRKTSLRPKVVNLDLNNTPDIAQTIAVTCLGLGIGCRLTGLHTLKIKETDRLQALRVELTKLGAGVIITEDSLELQRVLQINHNVAIDTYNDHRMAMAFAPLAIKVPIVINDAQVVSKSYPAFWDDFKKIGFIVETL
ncbi:3-phosphoshikimate 1-carboxyvinyltransferase [Flavobacterium alkalisoli]|uniref:3-phosphoshikimate 1-carboxyvinyltransferase n=1 Tax=Flavobacterium alkalisoli TaxID=2602769 RepID=A0A5B9FQP6_9FLAO|nr:3-phosphoshikimate 1-carboxyvinyltransferase [Flavobacterium alkalisoli]QEE49290.1 3-phosphoshikimate 1-carboxyvinyltransferase [Flavobacterium alkalisoli]